MAKTPAVVITRIRRDKVSIRILFQSLITSGRSISRIDISKIDTNNTKVKIKRACEKPPPE